MKDLPTKNEIKESIIDCNTPYRCLFRCWIDGSYLGFAHYQSNCAEIREHYYNDSVLRACAIEWFCDFIAHEKDCSPRTVLRHMLKTVSRDELEALNVELIDDLRNLVPEDIVQSA